MQVSIIIVNYNTKDLTCSCLESIYANTKDIEFEVFVSDNGSSDGSVAEIRKQFPLVKIIENNDNLGFGAANNRALERATGKYVFYLNSDTVLLNNAVKMFYDYWESSDKSLGVLGTTLLDKDLNPIHSYGKIKGIDEKLNEYFHCVYGVWKNTVKFLFGKKLPTFSVNHSQRPFVGKVEYVTGADMFMLNDAFAKFDERFFMYCEDTDMQLNLSKHGRFSFIIEGPKIIHLEGGSTKKEYVQVKHFGSQSQIQLFISDVKFMRKNYNSFLKISLMKLLILLIWCNPLIIKKTYRFIPKLFVI